MNNNSDSLKPIAIEFLFEGLKVSDDIYNYDGTIKLVTKGVVLTNDRINSIKKYNNYNRNIRVSSKTYGMLIEHKATPKEFSQKFIEEKTGYAKTTEKTKDYLREIEERKSVSKSETEQITNDMLEKLASVDQGLIFQCINAPNLINEYLQRHSVNVGFINGLFGKWLKLPQEDIDLLVMSGLVHDIGKVKIPKEILDAPRKLNAEEFEIMKQHTIYSYELLSNEGNFPEEVKLAARHHHERMNGTGYPDGINVNQLSLYARITAISDIYDAMVSKRCYKDPSNPFLILSQLAKMQFSDLDIFLVDVFTRNMPYELLNKAVLLSDGSIGTTRFVVANDLEFPIVEVNSNVIKTDKNFHCVRLVFDE